MNWRAHIEAKKMNGWTRHDYPWCSYGKIETEAIALKRAENIFKKRGFSIDNYVIKVYKMDF